jgi:Holliday junction resolvase RusA-like endonuclease
MVVSANTNLCPWMVKLIVPGLPNPKVGLNSRSHFLGKNSSSQKEKERLADLIIMSGEKKDPLWDKVRIEFTFVSKDKRLRDIDNLIGCAKPWIDALQGLIVPSDNWRHVCKISAEYFAEDVEESYSEILIIKS